jgi:PAS domain S-box-containing protein
MLDLVPQEFPSTSFRNQILRRLHPDDLAALERANVDARATAGPVSFQGRMHVRGDTRWMRFDVAQNVEANGEHIWFGVVADVTDRRRIELQQASELSALEALAREQPLAALLSEFASGYEAMFPGAIASVLLVDPERRQLRHAAASRLADAYVAAIDGIEIGPLAGSFGAAASSGTTVIVEDIATDPRWQDRRDLAAAHGLAACWAHPLLSTRREVLGTIAVYYAVRRAPRPEELAAIERAAHLASFALERHAALLALAQSEARFRRFYNETPALLYSCDREGRFVSVSDHWLAVTGYARDEVTGRPLVDFVDADCRRRLIEVEQPEFLRTGQRTDVPFQLIGKRGARIDVVVSSTAERNADGVIIRSLSVMTDVTQRNRADAALRQHSENLDALHRFTLDLLDRRDMNDLLQTVVDRAAVMVSARFGVLLLLEQQRLTISACSRDQPLLAEAPLERGTGVLAWRAIDTRLPATIDDYAAWPERRAVYDPLGLHAILDLPVLLRGDCLGVLELARDVPGQPFTEAELQCGLLFAQMAALVIEHRRMYDGAVRELAERARAEMALREHEGRLAGIIESAIDAIITVDEEQKIIVFNRAAERTFGCTAESALGRSLDDFVPDRARVEHREHLRRFQASGETSRAKTGSAALVGRRAGGEEFPIEASISRVEVGGRQLSTVMLRDVADQRSAEANQAQLEAQLRESQKLEAIGTLAGGIAHDFNNIVGTILGNVELVRQDIGKAGSAEQSLEEIRKAGHRARDLIRQIVAFSRNEPQDRRLVDLRSVVEATLRMLRPIIPAGTELHAQLPPSGLHVEGDPKQLQQVLVNLTANAWHALGGGAGRIDIVLDTLDLDGNVPPGLGRGRYAHLALKDSGVGMDAATLERIFEPFFTTREAGDGAGLGLSVVHGIVKSHHGRVDVASEPGQGSTFHVYLPLLAAPRDAQTVEQAVDDTGRQQRRGHVLYVDDDEALVFLATRMLARQGLKVTGHYRASDALAAIRSNPAEFDLLVTDYNMPGMSGVDLARHVAAIRADLPVVLTSGYITDAVRAAAIDTGIRHLVYKPNTVDELCDVVLRLLRDQARR